MFQYPGRICNASKSRVDLDLLDLLQRLRGYGLHIMSAMQHTGGVFRKVAWLGSEWPPISAFPDAQTDDDNFLKGCKVIKITNLALNKGSFTGYMSGKKTTDVQAKMTGVEVELPAMLAPGVSDDLLPFIQQFLKADYTEGQPLDAVTAGDGRTFTFVGENTMMSALRAEAGTVGDDPLQAGDEITITTRGKSLFLRSVEVSKRVRTDDMRSQHAVQSMYVQKAVNVDEGLVDNLKGNAGQIEQAQARAEELAKKNAAMNDDVDDDEWD